MDPKNKKEESIFKAAIQYEDREERESYLTEACQNDPRLLASIRTLLQFHDSNSFLDDSAIGPMIAVEDSLLKEGPGTVVGRYKLIEKIGEGGMAVVYMAEQERPVRRNVALKIIKLGMDTRQVIARFEAERQALALMDHPNIAKVHDAGATETGRPYFVMELVKGTPITNYGDENHLTTLQRLDLFVSVCNAVQHAHQKGIIHRDIKPTNILVTLHDGKPVAKIIDFGIAKAINQKLTEKTLVTNYSQLIGTPAYMSPEQAEWSGLDVDTRTDIYSLGILLYELLTGCTPFDGQRLRETSYNEMQRIIREEEPTRPSTKLQKSVDTLNEVAHNRDTTPDSLRRLLRGDLDWIVMKALEKNRIRRYETAAEFGTDIKRYLNNEPVTAAAPSISYKLGKFIKRNKIAVGTVLIIIIILSIGITVATLGLFQAKKSLASAQIERGVRLLNDGNTYGLLDLLEARTTANRLPGLRESASRFWSIGYDLWGHRLVNVLPGGQDLTYSPDGKLLAIAKGQKAQIWNLQTSQPHLPPMDLGKTISIVLFSSDGKLLITSSIMGRTALWDVLSGKLIGGYLQLKESDGIVVPDVYRHCCVLSDDGKYLVTSTFYRTSSNDLSSEIQLWEIPTGKRVGETIKLPDAIFSVALDPENRMLATGSSNGYIGVWDIPSGKPVGSLLGEYELENRKLFLAFHPKQKLFAAELPKGTLSIWNPKEKEPSIQLHHESKVTQFAFSPQDENLIVTCTYDGNLKLWDFEARKVLWETAKHHDQINIIKFSPDSQVIWTGSNDRTIRIWDTNTGKSIGPPLHHQDGIWDIEFSPDGKCFASTTRDGTTKIWHTYPSLLVQPLQKNKQQEGAINLGKHIQAVINGKSVIINDTISGEEIANLSQYNDVRALAFSPDGKYLAIGAGNLITLWDIDKRQVIQKAWTKGGYASSFAFNPDNKLLAVGEGILMVRVLAVDTMKCLHELRTVNCSYGLSFDTTGKILAIASLGGQCNLYDITTGKMVSSSNHKSKLWTVTFSPQDSFIATASGKNADTIHFWDQECNLIFPYQAGLRKLIFQKQGSLYVRSYDGNKTFSWQIPQSPSSLREMKLRTWLALGVCRNEKGGYDIIEPDQWQLYRKELCEHLESDKISMLSRISNNKDGSVLLVNPKARYKERKMDSTIPFWHHQIGAYDESGMYWGGSFTVKVDSENDSQN